MNIQEQEKAFWLALEANPNDNDTRLVFADWLQDQKDPVYKIMRLMAEGKIKPAKSEGKKKDRYWSNANHFGKGYWRIPQEVFELLEDHIKTTLNRGVPLIKIKFYPNRYKADRDLIEAYRRLYKIKPKD